MSSCQCCFQPHPHQLLQRYLSSIQSIKLIRKTSIFLQDLLLDQSEQFERILVHFNVYLMQDRSNSYLITSHCLRLIKQLNDRLNQSTKCFTELEYLIDKCSNWLKKNNTKKLRRQLKSFRKQFDRLHKFSKDFSKFHRDYHQQALQMDAIEFEHLKLFQENYRIISSSLFLDNSLKTINIEQIIVQWKEQNRFHIPYLTNEHQSKENIIEKIPSEIDIKPIDDNASQDTYAYESNLSWSFTIPLQNEETNSQSEVTTTSKNRVRLAVEAIERNQTSDFPRGRKS